MDFNNDPAFQCPECGAVDDVNITAVSSFEYGPEGTGDHDDVVFDDYSPCECRVCEFRGMAGVFSRSLEGVQSNEREAVLTLKVTYESDGGAEVSGDVIRALLEQLVERELGNGGLTGDTELLVASHSVEITL